MKARILSLLKAQYPGYISGEDISRELGVSRTAVWKHIKILRENGYHIESHSKIGYRLVRTPDKLYRDELKDLLQTTVIGKEIIYRDTVGSTNDVAKDLAVAGAEDGTIVVAEEQTAGKGRMGRVWFSPSGKGLWFSIILRPVISPADAPKITLVSAVAVAGVLREMGIPAGIKWPNDVLIHGRKLAGILTEMNAEIDKVHYLIVGIGMNVNLGSENLPDELRDVATSLQEYYKGEMLRTHILAAILNKFDSLYRDFSKSSFNKILASWKEMSVTLNQKVRVRSIHTVEEGVAFDVDEEGALLLIKEDGTMKRVLSGEVSLA